MTLLDVSGVSKSFGGLRALTDVSFAVEAGEIVGLMGANGAGKTTLFSIIAGHARASRGDVRFRGRSIAGLRPDRICRLGIARTFQIVRPFAGLSARENVETALIFGGRVHKRGDAVARRALEILDEVGLADQAEKPAGALTLSGRKRLEVARALGTGPALLLLDEVMAGLTPTEVAAMLATVQEIRRARGLTILIVEHVVRALVELSERIVVLHHGELIATGTPRQIERDPAVRAVYFGEAAG
ncbi:MAG: ABC transporter ATP-binding protein [Alphaproteobacteria bacterium]